MTVTLQTVPLDYIEVPSGRFISVDHPDPADITLYDVAHKLAQTIRFGGSGHFPYSVAQHAVFVAERLRRQGASRRRQLQGLHHDDPEAFLGDIPRPWKKKLNPVYSEMTATFEVAINEALNLPTQTPEDHVVIKAADNFALLIEARLLLPSGGHRWDYLKDFDLPSRIVIPPYFMGEQHWTSGRDAYLARHEELTSG